MLRKSMRGADDQQNHIFSYLSPEERVRNDHPLRAIRAMVDEALTQLSGQLDAMYASVGRPSIAPEKLLRALRARGDSWSQIQTELGVSKGTAQRAFAGLPKIA
jgi:hypothetical protein